MAVVILRPTPDQVAIDWEYPIAPGAIEVLCIRRLDNGAWTLVIDIVNPGEGLAIVAARGALEEADIRTKIHRPLSVEVVGPVTYYSGDVTAHLDVIFAARWVSGEPSPANGEDSETMFFRGDQLPPMKDRFRRAVAETLSVRPDTDPLIV